MSFFGLVDRNPRRGGILSVDVHWWWSIRQVLSVKVVREAGSPLWVSMGTSGDHGSTTVWTVVETCTAIVVTSLGFSFFVNGGATVVCFGGWANMFVDIAVERV